MPSAAISPSMPCITTLQTTASTTMPAAWKIWKIVWCA
ncbi:Uncharacterised protein [Vibrio cholerae]|nr:Uncharacterised protein [Vibrio cholerae]